MDLFLQTVTYGYVRLHFTEAWTLSALFSPLTVLVLYLVLVLFFPQDPAKADSLYRVQQDLDETKIILHKTIESVLHRGEKLDNLVQKSSDLSSASQIFYKQVRGKCITVTCERFEPAAGHPRRWVDCVFSLLSSFFAPPSGTKSKQLLLASRGDWRAPVLVLS